MPEQNVKASQHEVNETLYAELPFGTRYYLLALALRLPRCLWNNFTPGARPNLRPKRAKIYALSEPPPVVWPVIPNGATKQKKNEKQKHRHSKNHGSTLQTGVFHKAITNGNGIGWDIKNTYSNQTKSVGHFGMIRQYIHHHLLYRNLPILLVMPINHH